MSQRLPHLPNLDHLKKQAKDVLRVSRHRTPRWRLADAQHALARGYGFPTWPDLKAHVASVRRQSAAMPANDHQLEEGKPGAARRTAPSSPPIVGAWAARPVSDNGHPQPDGVVVEFALVEDVLIVTQIAADSAGRDIATKMAIKADGIDHPILFGDALTLQATWSDARTLETIVKHRDQIVGAGTYEVAADGRSLVLSTPEQRIVFERV